MWFTPLQGGRPERSGLLFLKLLRGVNSNPETRAQHPVQSHPHQARGRRARSTGGDRRRPEATGGERRRPEATGSDRRRPEATGGDRRRSPRGKPACLIQEEKLTAQSAFAQQPQQEGGGGGPRGDSTRRRRHHRHCHRRQRQETARRRTQAQKWGRAGWVEENA